MTEVQSAPAPVITEPVSAPVVDPIILDKQGNEDNGPVQPIEVNDAYFCKHWKEVCQKCPYDGREENDSFYGFDPIDREGLEAPAAVLNKDGEWTCKKHGSKECSSCFGWKKQITKLRNAAKKAPKKAKHWTDN